jgi:cation transport ATPase
VLEGLRCQVDESLLSGESSPVTRRRGDRVIAGSIVVDGPVDVASSALARTPSWRASLRSPSVH